MRGIRRSGFFWLLAALCSLCSATSWGDVPVYDGPELPEGWYPIHETELTALETNSETIATQTLILRTMFATLLETVQTWQTESIERTTRIETSLTESENAVEAVETQTRAIQTELWVYRASGAVLAALTIWALIR